VAAEIPNYDHVKTRQCKERRNVLRTEENPEDNSKIVFSEEVLLLENNSSLLRIDHTDNSGKTIFIIAEVKEYLLASKSSFL
jgi:hypothetical protein